MPRWRAIAVTSSPRRPWAWAWCARGSGRVPAPAAIAATMNSVLSPMVTPSGRCRPAQMPCKDVQGGTAAVERVLEQHEQLLDRPRDPVRLADHQGAAGLQHAEGTAQLRPVVARARGLHDHLITAVRRS